MGMMGQPKPLGQGRATQEAHSIAAPMLTAAALALAGVVAGANPNVFVWPGPTLLVLVAASLALVASIQLHYHASHFYYSAQDVDAWYGPDLEDNTEAREKLLRRQRLDFDEWKKFIQGAIACFNAGTLLLGIGVSLALAPSDGDTQAVWRWVAVAMVLLCTLMDMAWIAYLYKRRAQYAMANSALNAS
jgi:uncharacterized membrane protein AbrB (regulator of aidB expression)